MRVKLNKEKSSYQTMVIYNETIILNFVAYKKLLKKMSRDGEFER